MDANITRASVDSVIPTCLDVDVGTPVGYSVCSYDGITVGGEVGTSDVGAVVGISVGPTVVGILVGSTDGCSVGTPDVGAVVGALLGEAEGTSVGVAVGTAVVGCSVCWGSEQQLMGQQWVPSWVENYWDYDWMGLEMVDPSTWVWLIRSVLQSVQTNWEHL